MPTIIGDDGDGRTRIHMGYEVEQAPMSLTGTHILNPARRTLTLPSPNSALIHEVGLDSCSIVEWLRYWLIRDYRNAIRAVMAIEGCGRDTAIRKLEVSGGKGWRQAYAQYLETR